MHKTGAEASAAAVRSVELVSYVARDVCGRSFKLLMFLVFHTRDAALGRNLVERYIYTLIDLRVRERE